MEPEIEVPIFCKYCHLPVTVDDYFCPHCGKKLKEKPAAMELWPLVWLFVLSSLLPPLGIGLTIRYIRSEDERARSVGWISLFVTIVALIVSILIAKSVMDSVNQQINTQMQNYNF